MKTLKILLLCIFLLTQSLISFCQWTSVPSGTKSELYSIHFPSDSIGYIAGRNATILKTNDGGNSWNSLNVDLDWEIFTSIYFINDSIGFTTGATNGKVLKTIDGGDSWSINTFETSNDLYDIKFLDDSIGFIVGYREIWKTIDQGKTWTSQYDNQSLAFPVFYSIELLNKDTIFIAGVDGETGRILKTVDGGDNWISTSFSQDMRFDVKFVNDSVGYNVGSNSDIYKTTNGGLDWTLIADPDISNNRKLLFINESIGYTVGYDGHILSTTDGGVTWLIDETNTTKNLNWLHFINENKGFAVGDDGTILKLVKEEAVTALTEDDNYNELIDFFPNPASSIININIKNQQNKLHIRLLNNLGELIYAENNGEINKSLSVANLPDGLYYLAIQTSKNSIKKKVIILH